MTSPDKILYCKVICHWEALWDATEPKEGGEE